MPGCCAFGCTNNSTAGYKLYRLPVGKSNEGRRKVWLDNIGREKWKPNDYCRLCEVHFTEDQFENHRADNRRLLKRNAVPTCFSHLQGSRKPSKYILQKNYVDFPNGNDQPCADTLRVPSTESKVAQGNDQASVDTINPFNHEAPKITIGSYEKYGAARTKRIKLEVAESEIVSGNDQASVDTINPFNQEAPEITIGSYEKYGAARTKKIKLEVAESEIVSGNEEASVDTLNPFNPEAPEITMGSYEKYGVARTERVKSEVAESEIVSGNDDQASVDTLKLEVAESEIVSVPELLLSGSSESPSNKDLITEVENLKRKLQLLQKKLRQQKHDNENLQKNLSSLFTNDQVDSMKRGFNGKQVWSNETMEKAVKIFLACHTKGYNYLKESGYPLPSLRTVQRRIKMKPDISHV